MSRPARTALDATWLFLVGLGALVVLALVTYQPGGPRWPHVVVNGTGWALVSLCVVLWSVAAADAGLARLRRRA
ncbi:MAG: hypothetical protein PGN07_06205 [Aeromicrobium erythreum]